MKKLFIIFLLLLTGYACLPAGRGYGAFAQNTDDLELTVDFSAKAIPLPSIFKPNIDLSGRGFNRQAIWPQTLSEKETLEAWEKDIGFRGLYRLQYSLWEINQLSKDKESQNKLLNNYESIIKKISDAGGAVILDIFGTPAGLGRVLDRKSPPWDLRAFKELIKGTIRELSCNKRYNIWYEVWNAPDLDDFFLGRKQEYLNLYRAVAEAVNELKNETKIHIPLGGPSVSWWCQNLDGNTVLTPEKSLIYELIKFCYRYRLPLDFISWHSYSTSPNPEKEDTIYKKKTAVNLIRDWLTYFGFQRNTPLIIDEWNYDRDANVLPERKEKSYICSSYVLSRIKNMYEAGIDYQLYFCLEDFYNEKEGVVRNVGLFYFDPEHSEYKGGPKSTYNAFRMLCRLGDDLLPVKFEDEFVGVIAAKGQDSLSLIIYNYIDPEIAVSFLSKGIANLSGAERKFLLNTIKSDKLEKIMQSKLDISGLRTTNKVKNLLKKAQELSGRAKAFSAKPRNLKITIKGLKGACLYQIYKINSSCSLNCEFTPAEEKEVNITEDYLHAVSIESYSVQMITLKKKPKESADSTSVTDEEPAAKNQF